MDAEENATALQKRISELSRELNSSTSPEDLSESPEAAAKQSVNRIFQNLQHRFEIAK